MKRSRPATVLLGTVVLTLGLMAPASAVVLPNGQHCRNDMVTERNTCATPVQTQPLTRAQKAQLAALKAGQTRALASARFGRQSRAGVLLPPIPPPPPLSYVLPELERMRLFKEGEGNAKKHYTCGPSATRNMIAALYKSKKGHYKDFTEAYFERIERTTSAGTARKNIADALNSHLTGLGGWFTTRPGSADAYLAYVMVDTTKLHRSVIANLNTGPLRSWNGKNLPHFNVVHGYDTRGRKRLRIAEEWDPIYIYGRSNYGNPYGHHWEWLSDAFRAISNSSIHGIVA